jgi:hypothetical protein
MPGEGENKFGPQNPEIALLEFRKAMIKEVEAINNTSKVKRIMERLNIIASPESVKDLNTAKEVILTFARGYKQSELEILQRTMDDIDEEGKDLE